MGLEGEVSNLDAGVGIQRFEDKLLNHRFVVVCRYYIQVSDLDIEK